MSTVLDPIFRHLLSYHTKTILADENEYVYGIYDEENETDTH